MKKLILTATTAIMLTVPVMANEAVTVYSNGNEVADKGIIIEGRTMVPVRGVFEYMGYEVEWDANTKTATLTNTDKETVISLTSGDTTFTVNDEEITPDVPQQIVDGRFMLPLRAVGEAVNAEVKWESETKTAYIDNSGDSTTNNTTDNNNKFELVDNGDGSFTIPGVKIEIVDDIDLEDNATEIVIE